MPPNISHHRLDHEVRGIPWEGAETPPDPKSLPGEAPGKAYPACSWKFILEAAKLRPTTMCPAKQKLNLMKKVFCSANRNINGPDHGKTFSFQDVWIPDQPSTSSQLTFGTEFKAEPSQPKVLDLLNFTEHS